MLKTPSILPELKPQMSKQIPEIQTQDIDHLGIIAGIVDEIGIVEKINSLIGTHPLEKVSAGQIVKAMILNCMGFVAAPLYLFNQFFIGKATAHLIGEGVLPEHLNDDRLGRVLDDLYRVGLSKIFLEIALIAAKTFGISTARMHLDGTSFHVHGEYENSAPELPIEASSTAESLLTTTSNSVPVDIKLPIDTSKQLVNQEQENQVNSDYQTIEITYGYSREHRPDLKQYLMNIMSSSDGGIPLFFHVGNGNEAEKSRFPLLIQEFKKQWTFDEIEVFVADSALYSADNINTLGELPWISRVPLSIKQAKNLVETLFSDKFSPTPLQGYKIAEVTSNYGNIEQRWLVVESLLRRETDLKQFNKQLDKQQKIQQAAIQKLSTQEFSCEADTLYAAEQLARKMKFHYLENIQVVEKAHYQKSGRPGKDKSPSRLTYHLQANLAVNTEAVAVSHNKAGRFILATNLTDTAQWTHSNVLQEYKKQSVSERGFKFLKDPIFFAESVFVKSSKRVAALAMIMALCLLVYTIGQRQLRSNLIAASATLPNQLGKPSQSPTLRWIFQCFQSVHIVFVSGVKLVSNLTDQRQYILQFLSSACQQYYLLC
jgi:transposase